MMVDLDSKELINLKEPKQILGYNLVDILGTGGFSAVFKGTKERGDGSDTVIAIKIYESHKIDKAFWKHVGEMRFFDPMPKGFFDYIVQPFDHGEVEGTDTSWDGSLYITMEHMDMGSLADLIENEPLSLEDKLLYMEQAAMGMKAGHEEDIYHLDISLRNIVVDSVKGAKLTDWTFSTKLKKRKDTFTRKDQPMSYQAPIEKYDEKTDFWLFGATLLEALTGIGQGEHIEARDRLREGYKDIPDSIKELIFSCTSSDKSKRPKTADEIIHTLRDTRENYDTNTKLEDILTRTTSNIREIGKNKGKYGVLSKSNVEKLYKERDRAYSELNKLGVSSEMGRIESIIAQIRESDSDKTFELVKPLMIKHKGDLILNPNELDSSQNSMRKYLWNVQKSWKELSGKKIIYNTETGRRTGYE